MAKPIPRRTPTHLQTGAACIAAIVLAACGQPSPPLDQTNVGGGGGDGGTAIEASATDVTITSPAPNIADGTDTNAVSATVYIPAHNEGEQFPLVLHGHGWGGDRYSLGDAEANEPVSGTELSNNPNVFTAIDRNVETLWNAGFAVISFDQRGFGRGDDGDMGTSDGAHAMDPRYEVVDVQAIIDWAAQDPMDLGLSLVMDGPDDPRVGSIGGSYGGGYQLLTGAVDPRLDALVPTATWYNFAQSLSPNRVIKKGYASGLCLLAQTDQAQLSDEVATACQEGSTDQTTRFQEELSQGTQDVFLTHGLNIYAEDAAFTLPALDVLLMQGNRDILFDMNQSVDNFDALRAAGGDVRLITHENGHSLSQTRSGPGSQGPLGPGTCGTIDIIDAMNAWLAVKLGLSGGSLASLPTVCISLDDTRGVFLDDVPRGTAEHRVTIDTTTITATQHNNTTSEAGQAVFVPLAEPIAGDGQLLAGIPIANITVSDVGLTEGTVFIGTGIQRGGSTFLVDQQVVPVRSSDERAGDTPTAIELVGIGEVLQDGDVVGVLVYGQFDQFENEARTNYASNTASITGTVDFPIITAPVSERATP